MAFSFLKYLLSFSSYLGFCIMQMRKVMTPLIVPHKDKSLNHNYNKILDSDWLLAHPIFYQIGARAA